MSAQHTPGPWETRRAAAPDNTGGYDWAIAKDGKVLAEAFENVGYEADGVTYDKRPAEANARLIAAAPELLEALELAVEELGTIAVSYTGEHGLSAEEIEHHGRICDLGDRLCAVIAKTSTALGRVAGGR